MRILVRFTTCAGHDLEEVRQAPAARHRASGRRTGLNATCVQHRAVTFESVRSGTHPSARQGSLPPPEPRS